MTDNRALSLISISAKAGKAASGETAVLDAIRSGKARLVIIAADASEGTADRMIDKCSYYGVRYLRYSDKETLGRSLGKSERSSAAILDDGLADALFDRVQGR